MRVIRVIVIDDEKALHIVLKRLLSQIDSVEVVGCFQTAREAIEHISNDSIDLVFIDIMIGQDNGLEVARQLRSTHRELEIVFLTSHKEYAIDSFESYPLDYMIKPVSKLRLEQTIARVAARLEQRSQLNSSESNIKLHVRGLGGFQVSDEQGRLVRWISKKSTELFAYLLIHRGRSVSKSRIIEHIFSDMPQKNATTYLNTTVYQLRKSLHALGHKNIIIYSQDQYSLSLDNIEVDFIRFEEEVALLTKNLHDYSAYDHSLNSSDYSAHDHSLISHDQLRQALACEQLYTGELFEDRWYEWSHPEQVRLQEVYTRFVKQLSRSLLNNQRLEEASQLTKRLLVNNEWDEEANLLLLQAYQAMNDRISFLLHYEHVSKLYQRELSIPISEQFTKMYEEFVDASGGWTTAERRR